MAKVARFSAKNPSADLPKASGKTVADGRQWRCQGRLNSCCYKLDPSQEYPPYYHRYCFVNTLRSPLYVTSLLVKLFLHPLLDMVNYWLEVSHLVGSKRMKCVKNPKPRLKTAVHQVTFMFTIAWSLLSEPPLTQLQIRLRTAQNLQSW